MAASPSDDHQRSTAASCNRWTKAWVSDEDNKVTGGKLSLLKWIREDKLEAMKEKLRKSEINNENDQKQEEIIREILYLCSHESCGRTFKDLQSLINHADQIHKKKHACGKAFSLTCSFNGCNKRFRSAYKLANHINKFHQKNEMRRRSKPVENTSRDRPYKCPFEGCDKDYIHEYKLKIHLKIMHQHGNNVNDVNGDVITSGASSSKKPKPKPKKSAKPIARRGYTLDQQTSESMNMMRIQRECINECNEEEEEEEGDEDEKRYDSEETEDDDKLSNYIISSRGERDTMD